MKKKIISLIFKILMLISLLIIIVNLLSIIAIILIKGIPVLNWDMVFKTPQGGFYLGKEGGVFNAISGSLILTFTAVILALFIALPLVFYINFYLKKDSKLASLLRFTFDVLCGIPSIVYGVIGLTIMYFFHLRASLLCAIITVTIFILPFFTRAIDEQIRVVPDELKESSLALGITNWEMSTKIIFRQIIPGFMAALIITFGRAIGDAASVLFTAGFSDNIPTSLSRPAATLPLAIFFQLSSPITEVNNRAYASAIILTIIILIVNISAHIIGKNISKYKIN